MPPARNDPYKSFNFLVEIDGIASSFFQQVDGLGSENEVIEYREGAEKRSSSRKLPGRLSFPNVTLRRGLTADRALWDWRQTVVDGNVDRRSVTIALLDDAGQPVLRWRLREAYPTKWEVSELDASKSEIAIETLELAHEGLELDD